MGISVLFYYAWQVLFKYRKLSNYMKRHGMRYGLLMIRLGRFLVLSVLSCFCMMPFIGAEIEAPESMLFIDNYLFRPLHDASDWLCDHIAWASAIPFVLWGLISLAMIFVGADFNDKVK